MYELASVSRGLVRMSNRIRACMRTASTVSTSIAGPRIPTVLPPFNLSPRSTFPAWITRREKYAHTSFSDSVRDAKASLQVDASKLPCLSQWKRDYNMETVLIELRRYVLPGELYHDPGC